MTTATDAPSAGHQKPVLADTDKMLCSCVELTHAQAAAYLDANPGITFDTFLSATGAGEVCTACRLDLEYSFTTGELRPRPGVKARAPLAPAKQHLRHRIYALLDRISPLAGLVVREAAPILLGRHLRQSIAIANDRFMYGEETGPEPPAMKVDLIIRDGDGRVCHKMRHKVLAGEAIDVPVSDWLEPPEDDSLTCGSVEIYRRWSARGLRGTTRPQIIVEGESGCSAVHTQGISGPGERWLTATRSDGSERTFVVLVNCGKRAEYTVEFPYAAGIPKVSRSRVSTLLPAWGSRAFEVVPGGEAGVEENVTFGVRIDGSGAHKWFFATLPPALDRATIDHPASG